MDVEEDNVQDDRNGDEADGPGKKMFQSVPNRFRQVAQNLPQLFDGICTDKQNDKKSDKFDRKCAA